MKALRYEDRVRCLSSLILFISFARECIAYLSLSTEEIIARAGKRQDMSQIGFLRVLSRSDIGEDGFFSPWERAIRDLPIRPEDMSILLTWGESLGKTDRENQIVSCDAALAGLMKKREEAEREAVKQGRMWTSLGAIGGLFAVILLI